MTTLKSFINRLKKIGIEIELAGNFPWIYLDKVNGLKVWHRYMANHGCTIAWYPKQGEEAFLSDVEDIFRIVREVLKSSKTYTLSNYGRIKVYHPHTGESFRKYLRKLQEINVGLCIHTEGWDERLHISDIQESKTKKSLTVVVKWN